MLYYVDEQLKTWEELGAYRIQDMAYIKVFKSNTIGDEPSTQFKTGGNTGGMEQTVPPIIVSIYMRKGNDVLSLSEQWPGVLIAGYNPMLHFSDTRKDRTTLYWDPLVDTRTFLIRFQNNGRTKKFRINVAGITDEGKRFWYSTVFPESQ